MLGPAHQDQVGRVGRAAIQPVPQMVDFAPGQGALTVGEDTAAVAHGQGGGRGRQPGWSAPGPGLAGSPTQGRAEQVMAACSRWVSRAPAPRSWGPRWPPGSAWWSWGVVGRRVTRTRVTAPSQASRRQACGAKAPRLVSPPRLPGPTMRLSRSTSTVSWGRTPPAWGSRPPPGPAGQLGQGVRLGAGHRLAHDLGGQLVGAGGQDAGMSWGEVAVGQGLAGGGQLVNHCGQGGQPARRTIRMWVRVHGGNLTAWGPRPAEAVGGCVPGQPVEGPAPTRRRRR
jgi:hypothetical protein